MCNRLASVWYVIAGFIALWLVLYLAFRDRSGGRVEFLPVGVIVRAGISLEPMSGRRALPWRILGLAGIFLMAYLAFVFFRFVVVMFASKYLGYQSAAPVEGGVMPLIPGVTIPWSDMPYVVVAIGIAALVHELAHAFVARAEGMRVKDAGVAFFLFFPAAFVEPDEDELKRASLLSRLKVYAAGITANYILFLVLSFIFTLLLPHIAAGVGVVSVSPDSPAYRAGIQEGDIIVSVNGTPVRTAEDLRDVLTSLGFYDNTTTVSTVVTVVRGGDELDLEVHKRPGDYALGVSIVQVYDPQWLGVTLYSTILFNLVLAAVNAAPMAIPLPGGLLLTDGGHALRDVLARVGGRRGEMLALGLSVLVFLMLLSLMTLTPIRLTP